MTLKTSNDYSIFETPAISKFKVTFDANPIAFGNWNESIIRQLNSVG